MTDSSKMVRFFRSTDPGAPTLTGLAGGRASVIHACLVTGYGSVSVTSLVVAGGVATATVSAGHGFSPLAGVGPVLQIEGATPSALNVIARCSLPSGTTLTFPAPGVPDGTASGTITVKMAPAGWEMARDWGATDRTYRSAASWSTRLYLRVADNQTLYASVTGLTAIDPDVGSWDYRRWYGSSTADSTARPWILIADGATMYFLPKWSATQTHRDMYLFGDLNTLTPGDAYHCAIGGQWQAQYNNVPGTYNTTWVPLNGNAAAIRLAREYTQVGGGVAASIRGHCSSPAATSPGEHPAAYSGAYYLVPYPSGPDGSLIVKGPVEVYTAAGVRGTLPGAYYPDHPRPLADGDTVGSIVGAPGRGLVALWVGGSSSTSNLCGQALIDCSDWRA